MGSSLVSLGQNLQAQQPPGRLESLVNASPIVMFTCRAGGDFGATFLTEGVRTLWGYEPEDFLNNHSFWAERIHPDDVAPVYDQLARALESGAGRYDYRFRTQSGDYRWMHDELRLVKDASGTPIEIAGYCFDITDRKLAEAALRESEARQRVIFNSSSDLQVLFRFESGTFVTEAVNRALEENFQSKIGQKIEDYLERDFTSLLAATGLSGDEIEARRALYLKAVESRCVLRFEAPGSGLRDATEISVYPVMDRNGKCTHVLWNGRSIAARLQAEAARRESEERYSLVTDAIQEGIYDWDFLTGAYYLSPRYKEILGYRDHELENHSDSFFGRIHPDDRARMAETVERYNHDLARDRFNDELRLQHRDGSYRWVVSRGRILRNQEGLPIRLVGAVGDMTDRLESAAKLAASEKRLREIIESMFGFVSLFTLEGRMIECNRAVWESIKVPKEELLGRLFWEIGNWSSEEDRAQVKEMVMRAAQGEVVRFEASAMEGSEEVVAWLTLGPLRDQQGSITHIIGHGVDITAQKRAQADLLKAKEAAESASYAKSEFLANMSHEIRTPMNGIIGLTEVLLETALDAEQREYMTLVQSSAASLLTIINDILDVSKIEAGKLSLEIHEFDLHALIGDTLRTLGVSAKTKGLDLACQLNPNVPVRVLGDSVRLRQVLINLIGNAIKFTENGQVSLTITRPPESGELVRFSVRDTGIGIPPEKQSMIFEPFTQVDGSFTRRFGGTGLGLTIVGRLVQMMGGRIWVESRMGEGSAFHFTALLKAVDDSVRDSVGPAGL